MTHHFVCRRIPNAFEMEINDHVLKCNQDAFEESLARLLLLPISPDPGVGIEIHLTAGEEPFSTVVPARDIADIIRVMQTALLVEK